MDRLIQINVKKDEYDLNGLEEKNKSLKEYFISENNHPANAFSYRILVNAIEKEYKRHLEFQKEHMQIVRYKDEQFRLNLLSG